MPALDPRFSAPLLDAASWADPETMHRIFARLRREDPVHHGACEGFVDYWHITKHADIFDVERQSDVFLNEPRLVISPLVREEGIRALTGGSLNLIRSLVVMDKPEHPPMRLLTQAWFMPKNLSRLQGRIQAAAEAAFARMAAKGGACDFAQDAAVEYPLQVVMTVLGVPSEDYARMLRLTQELFGPEDPETRRQSEAADPTAALFETYAEYVAYFNRITEDRRAHPRDDVASLIANAEIDGKPITDDQILGYYIIIATAGHDTTSYSLTEAVYHLARDPALYERLKADPITMAPKIAEEAIRYAAPVRHFIRTAARDTVLRDRRILEGDSLILWYPSGSRDEAVFPDSDRFDPDRDTSVRHAAFGHAAHMCLGMHLARQEISTFLALMPRHVERLELAGPPAYIQASFVGGIKRLPVRAVMKGA